MQDNKSTQHPYEHFFEKACIQTYETFKEQQQAKISTASLIILTTITRNIFLDINATANLVKKSEGESEYNMFPKKLPIRYQIDLIIRYLECLKCYIHIFHDSTYAEEYFIELQRKVKSRNKYSAKSVAEILDKLLIIFGDYYKSI